jgi:signal transduction protein with GAF and PtsI domain
MQTVWYGVTSFIFAAVLFFPVRKLLLALNINRIQNKNKRAVTEDEIETMKKKVNVIATIIAVTFAFFYNKYMMLKFFKP